jgi:hypothetical protein
MRNVRAANEVLGQLRIDRSISGLANISLLRLRSRSAAGLVASVNAGQQVADSHSRPVGALNKQDIAKLHFRFHSVTAERHPVRRAGIATKRAVELRGVDQDINPTVKGGAVHLGEQPLSEVIDCNHAQELSTIGDEQVAYPAELPAKTCLPGVNWPVFEPWWPDLK